MEKTVITIARGYGSGGKTLGKLLADKLGVHCYDRDLIRMASEESGINEALFGEADEKVKSLPIFKIAKRFYKGEILPPRDANFTSDENLFNYQAKVIKQLADTESCVIIGRCADYVLKDYDNVISLYFYAPEEDCIKRIVDQYGGSEADAKKKMHQHDKYRAEYYKHYTGKDWNDARNYDFCLNTSSMSYEKLVDIVMGYIDMK